MNLRSGQGTEGESSSSVPAQKITFVFDVPHLGIKTQKCSAEAGRGRRALPVVRSGNKLMLSFACGSRILTLLDAPGRTSRNCRAPLPLPNTAAHHLGVAAERQAAASVNHGAF